MQHAAPPPSVSVVIPTYNRCRIIGRALASARAQSHPPAEIIVVDDCSSDDTAAVVTSLAGPGDVRLVSLARNAGGAGARNAGIRAATSTYVAFLDSDDEWDARHLELLVEKAKSLSGDFVLASSSFNAERRARTLPGTSFPTGARIPRKLHFILSAELAFQSSTLLMPRETALKFLFDNALRRHQDWDLSSRLIENDVPMILMQDPTSIYHRPAASNVSTSQSPIPSLRFLAKHKRHMPARSVFRFTTLQLARRRLVGVPLIGRLLAAALIGSISPKQFAWYAREAWRLRHVPRQPAPDMEPKNA